jgi:hypothetical protein
MLTGRDGSRQGANTGHSERVRMTSARTAAQGWAEPVPAPMLPWESRTGPDTLTET